MLPLFVALSVIGAIVFICHLVTKACGETSTGSDTLHDNIEEIYNAHENNKKNIAERRRMGIISNVRSKLARKY